MTMWDIMDGILEILYWMKKKQAPEDYMWYNITNLGYGMF